EAAIARGSSENTVASDQGVAEEALPIRQQAHRLARCARPDRWSIARSDSTGAPKLFAMRPPAPISAESMWSCCSAVDGPRMAGYRPARRFWQLCTYNARAW